MNARTIIAAAIMLVTAAVPLSIHAGEPVAVVLSCSGDVVVTRSNGDEVAGSFGLVLEEGDIIRTGNGAQAEIHFSNGSWIHVGSGSDMHINGTKAKSNTSAPEKADESFRRVQDFLKLKDRQGTTSLAMLRSVDKPDDLLLESPCQTKVRRSSLVFRWKSIEPAPELKLTLYNEDGIHWQQTIKDKTYLVYPSDAPALTAGMTYSWTLETTDPLKFPPVRSTAAFFEVLPSEEENRLDEDLDRLAAEEIESPAAHSLARASVYFSYGLFEDSIAETLKALEADPENTALHAILARLYAEVGKMHAALAHHNLLLENQ